MLEGQFQECADDLHVAAREKALGEKRLLPPPEQPVIPVPGAWSVEEILGPIKAALTETGLAQVQFGTPPSNERFRQLGEGLGRAMPENDQAVLPFVEQSVILNLVSRHGRNSDVSLQPFSTDYLTLHSECSARAVSEQPRYIVLLCHEPGDDATQAQTVLVPMDQVAERLPERAMRILKETRYRNSQSGPMLARSSPFGPTFSFRDFRSAALAWTSECADTTVAEVGEVLRLLLAAMYADTTMFGVHWRRGLMVIIDNFRFFHGRTCGAPVPSQHVRHLARLRLN